MPVELERKLRRRARKLGLRGRRLNAYVYGTMRKTGWRPSHQEGLADALSSEFDKMLLERPRWVVVQTPAPVALPDGTYHGLRYGHCVEIDGVCHKTSDCVKCTRERCGGLQGFKVAGGKLS